ncbi:MAG: hypothetical protein JWQ10_4027 [Herbaspirillum sp.]|jgi:hypothetical protein|nr:hypothetical protein [Herbaspirillum sp.]
MDVTQIAALATSLTQTQQADSLNIAMEKKALDIQKTAAAGLIAQLQPSSTTATLGQTVNTMA